MMSCTQWDSPPDGGYSWIVLVAATTHFFMQACCYSGNGVYLLAFREYFQEDMKTLSWIVACQLGMLGIAALAGGPLVKRWGGRSIASIGCLCISLGYFASSAAFNIPYMYITYGLTTGIGFGFYSVSVPVVLQQYFEKKKSRAFGVMMAGIALGAFAWAPLIQALVDQYTWRGAVIIQAGIHLQALIAASLLRPFSAYQKKKPIFRPEEPTKFPVAGQHMRDKDLDRLSVVSVNSQIAPEALYASGDLSIAMRHLDADDHADDESHCDLCTSKPCGVLKASFLPLATLSYLCHFLGHYFIQIGHFGILSFLPVRGAELGVSKQAGAFLPSIVGIFSGFGRIMAGFVGDRFSTRRPLISGLSAVIVGIITAVSVVFNSYAPVAAFSAIYGLIGSAYLSFLYVVVSDTLPLHQVAQGTGLIMLAVGLANLTGFPVTGAMIDVTGSASIPFVMFGGTLSFGGCLHCIGQVLFSRQRASQSAVMVDTKTLQK